ncbi:MAG: hypothetical protein U1F26_02140 [Lysobacterales bacterium]
MSDDDKKPFDPFELSAAILLGLGAIGASVAGYQEGLWGGQSVEAYGAASAMTTKASTTYNDELSTFTSDTQIDIRTKELIWEGDESEDETQSQRVLGMASWMLLSQISDVAYKHLGLPEDKRKAYMDGNGEIVLTHEELMKALETDLSDEYVDEVFGDSDGEFEAADKRFAEGSTANNNGDQFSLATVILTVSLFFAGVSLVFKTKARWGFLSAGAVILVAGLGYMSTLTWA